MFKETLKFSNIGMYLVPLAFWISSIVKYSKSEYDILGAAPAPKILICDSECLIVNKVQKIYSAN
jgi:hypothetical protein